MTMPNIDEMEQDLRELFSDIAGDLERYAKLTDLNRKYLQSSYEEYSDDEDSDDLEESYTDDSDDESSNDLENYNDPEQILAHAVKLRSKQFKIISNAIEAVNESLISNDNHEKLLENIIQLAKWIVAYFPANDESRQILQNQFEALKARFIEYADGREADIEKVRKLDLLPYDSSYINDDIERRNEIILRSKVDDLVRFLSGDEKFTSANITDESINYNRISIEEASHLLSLVSERIKHDSSDELLEIHSSLKHRVSSAENENLEELKWILTALILDKKLPGKIQPLVASLSDQNDLVALQNYAASMLATDASLNETNKEILNMIMAISLTKTLTNNDLFEKTSIRSVQSIAIGPIDRIYVDIATDEGRQHILREYCHLLSDLSDRDLDPLVTLNESKILRTNNVQFRVQSIVDILNEILNKSIIRSDAYNDLAIKSIKIILHTYIDFTNLKNIRNDILFNDVIEQSKEMGITQSDILKIQQYLSRMRDNQEPYNSPRMSRNMGMFSKSGQPQEQIKELLTKLSGEHSPDNFAKLCLKISNYLENVNPTHAKALANFLDDRSVNQTKPQIF